MIDEGEAGAVHLAPEHPASTPPTVAGMPGGALPMGRIPVSDVRPLVDGGTRPAKSVVGEEFDEFSRVHRTALTGQQFQSPDVEPVYVLFEDFTHVKFYRRSFFDVVEDEEGPFDGFVHVDDWVPQRLVTATGPNPLPR